MQAATAHSPLADPTRAGTALGTDLCARLGREPDVLIVFAAGVADHLRLLAAVREATGARHVIGCSSAGAFTGSSAEPGASAMAIHAPEYGLTSASATDLARAPDDAADSLSRAIGEPDPARSQRVVLLFTDAEAAATERFVAVFRERTGDRWPLVGGGAGNDAHLRSTPVFMGAEARVDAVTALAIDSPTAIAIASFHNWFHSTGELGAEARENGRVIERIGGRPVLDFLSAYADETGQSFDPSAPGDFFVHNALEVAIAGAPRLRLAVAVDRTGGVVLAAGGVPRAARVRMMRAAPDSSDAPRRSTAAALSSLAGRRVGAGLVFDCMSNRIRAGNGFQDELAAVGRLLTPAPFIGCNTFGQVAALDEKGAGFHNCTAAVCLLPA